MAVGAPAIVGIGRGVAVAGVVGVCDADVADATGLAVAAGSEAGVAARVSGGVAAGEGPHVASRREQSVSNASSSVRRGFIGVLQPGSHASVDYGPIVICILAVSSGARRGVYPPCMGERAGGGRCTTTGLYAPQ